VPPPVVFAAALAAGFALSWRFPTPWLPVGFARLFGWVFILSAAALGGTCVFLFLRQRTTIRPDRAAKSLVTTGPYVFTRNPMYVSTTALYIGVAVLWQSFWALLLLPAVIVFLDRHVIPEEEQHLSRKFGVQYEGYRTRVRRWI
jgi:protein-S-isoprenylcysteine O-methyltransferase Ste14